jgi:hypothetical protein
MSKQCFVSEYHVYSVTIYNICKEVSLFCIYFHTIARISVIFGRMLEDLIGDVLDT